MQKNKVNFKQPKYIIPLIALPFVLFMGYQIVSIFDDDGKQTQEQKDLNTSMGNIESDVLSKNDAYDQLFESTSDNRSMIQSFDKENDSLFNYTDNLDDKQKRYIDSLEYAQHQNLGKNDNRSIYEQKNYYNPNEAKQQQQRQQQLLQQEQDDDRDYERSKEIMRMLNETQQPQQDTAPKQKEDDKENYDPVKTLRQQMFFLDSLEKAKDPEAQRQMAASDRIRANKEKRAKFLNRSLQVTKANNLGNFNHIAKEQENNTIKAVIDENIKGFLGSRIRIRLLENIYVGKGKNKKLVPKGTFLYAEIAGFSQQRVYLGIVSVLTKNEILPINLSIFDTDGGKGLYVPSSTFREMTRELGANSVQGVNVESGQGFFTSLASNLFRSTSEAVAAIIRKNKVKLKYNSYIFLINEEELKNNNDEQ